MTARKSLQVVDSIIPNLCGDILSNVDQTLKALKHHKTQMNLKKGKTFEEKEGPSRNEA